MSKKKILYDFGHAHMPHSYTNDEIGDGIKERLDVLNEIYLVTESKLKTIANSTSLTPEGKHKARMELENQVRKQRKDWLRKQEKLDERIWQVKQEMKPKENLAGVTVTELRQREVRDYLKTLDLGAIEAEYRAAGENGNDLLLYAVENAPVKYLFLDEELITKVNLARSERLYPEEAARLRDLQIGRANVHSALRSVENSLQGHGINIADDPVADAAAA